jgi:uncharacterized membrane protein YoaK (UPF0700 family)
VDDLAATSSAGPAEKALLAVVLAAVAGFVDVVGYLALFGIFTAHMSGNSAAFGAAAGRGLPDEVALRGLPILFFVIGVAVAGGVIEFLARAGVRSPTAVALGAEVLCLVGLMAYAGLAVPGPPRQGTVPFFVLVALAVGAMAIQTATLRRVGGRTVRTTYVTGMLTRLAEGIVNYAFLRLDVRQGRIGAADGRLRLRSARGRIGLLAGIWGCYAAGGVLGAVLDGRWRLRALAVPVAVLVVVILVDVTRPVRPPQPGEEPLRRPPAG